MEQPFVRVLLLGENASGSSYLRWQLEKRGCHCWFAHSTTEAAAVHQEHKFDLILSTMPMGKFDPLLALLSSSSCKIYHCCPEEDSSWWLQLTTDGPKSASGPGMRPSEFLEMLDKMLAQRRARTLATQPPMPAIQPQQQAFKAAS